MHEPSPEADRFARLVVDSALAVHRELGPGYLESIYEEALCVELQERGIPFRRQVRVGVRYRGRDVGLHCVDLVVGDLLVVELKAIEAIAPVHFAQVRSYLTALDLELALVVNFHTALLKDGVRRVIQTRD